MVRKQAHAFLCDQNVNDAWMCVCVCVRVRECFVHSCAWKKHTFFRSSANLCTPINNGVLLASGDFLQIDYSFALLHLSPLIFSRTSLVDHICAGQWRAVRRWISIPSFSLSFLNLVSVRIDLITNRALFTTTALWNGHTMAMAASQSTMHAHNVDYDFEWKQIAIELTPIWLSSKLWMANGITFFAAH